MQWHDFLPELQQLIRDALEPIGAQALARTCKNEWRAFAGEKSIVSIGDLAPLYDWRAFGQHAQALNSYRIMMKPPVGTPVVQTRDAGGNHHTFRFAGYIIRTSPKGDMISVLLTHVFEMDPPFRIMPGQTVDVPNDQLAVPRDGPLVREIEEIARRARERQEPGQGKNKKQRKQ